MEIDREGSSAFVSQPHALEGVGEHLSNQYFPHTCGSEMGNHQHVTVNPHPQMSYGTHAVNPPFQQMAEFFHYMVDSMHDTKRINFEKMGKMGGLEFEGVLDPTDVERWMECRERCFLLDCSDVAKFKYAISLLQKYAYDWWINVLNAKVKLHVLLGIIFLRNFVYSVYHLVIVMQRKRSF